MISAIKGISIVISFFQFVVHSLLFIFLFNFNWIYAMITTIIIAISTYFLVIFSIEKILFKETENIYKRLDKIKKKDIKIIKKNIRESVNPIERLNEEISNYVDKKEEEVENLKSIETYRREFLADISHELKTPIFAAQGFIHTLLDGALDDKNVNEKFLKKAAKSLDNLNFLVQDVLTLSQMETGDIKMHFENFIIDDLIYEIFEQLEDKADKKQIKLKLQSEFNQKITVKGDPLRLRQVFTNLIDNGIKYGKEDGKLKISLSLDKEFLFVSVSDDGPGIEPEHLVRIFERFYRVEKSRSKDKGGVGLGLAIVDHVLQLHHTKISVTSKINKGTTFSFKLKIPKSQKLVIID